MPATIEAKINLIPGVAESLVFAKDDKLYAQVTVQKKELFDEVRMTILSNAFDIHRLYDVECSTESLPKNSMGKIKRKIDED